jgi:hypothetical protein
MGLREGGAYGREIGPLLFKTPGNQSCWDDVGFCYYRTEQLQAVRAGPWELYLSLEKEIDLQQPQDRHGGAGTRRRAQ